MTLIRWSYLALTVLTFGSIVTAQVGTNCLVRGKAGVCKAFKDCAAARNDVRNGIPPTRCQSGGGVVVCCAGEDTTLKPLTCPPVPTENVFIQKDGRKARDACIDWHQLIHPCVTSVRGDLYRKNVCGHVSAPLILGGTEANPKEFPHMALLGYEISKNNISWQCGGALISDQWVLTAAHCAWSPTGGDVAKVRLGETKTSRPIVPEDVYDVVSIQKHPSYTPKLKYDDIALLKLDRKVKFGDAVIPACLHVGESINDNKAMVCGWGLTVSGDVQSASDALLKVTLEKFPYEDCNSLHEATRKNPDGIRNSTQICFGHHTEKKDACQGDSGSPIQVYNNNVECMYTVIGVTSYGKGCGSIGLPGIYTRVEAYIPWIESIVWP